MTELLTQSLCELLPHKTICKDCETDFVGILSQVDVGFGIVGLKGIDTTKVGNIPYCKPYLFPLSSMNEEQKEKHDILIKRCDSIGPFTVYDFRKLVEFYNKNHIDYKGLIPKGLAIEVTTNNNPYK